MKVFLYWPIDFYRKFVGLSEMYVLFMIWKRKRKNRINTSPLNASDEKRSPKVFSGDWRVFLSYG